MEERRYLKGGFLPASEVNKHLKVTMPFDQVPKIQIPNIRWVMSVNCSFSGMYRFWSGELLNTTPN
jgi:hypothetical protein